MPYPAEHSCRLAEPDQFDEFRRSSRQHEGKTYGVIYGKPKGGGGWEEQAYRYPKGAWTAGEARAHCGSHEGRFEAAATGKDLEGLCEKTGVEHAWINGCCEACGVAQPRSWEQTGAPAAPEDAELVMLDFGELLSDDPDEIRLDPEDLKDLFREAVTAAAEHVVDERMRKLTGRLD